MHNPQPPSVFPSGWQADDALSVQVPNEEAIVEIAVLLVVVFFSLVGLAVWFAMRDPPAAQAPTGSSPAVSSAPEPAPEPRPRTLFELADAGETEAVKTAIRENAERLHLRDESGWTALHHAAYNDRSELIAFLVAEGADVNAAAEGECAPIHMVATDGSPAALEKLIEGGADVSLPDDTGATALHFAALNRRVDLVKALIEAGAPVNMKDHQQETALDVARRVSQDEIASAIEGADGRVGADVSMKEVLAALPEDAAARSVVPRAYHLDVEDTRYLAAVERAKATLPAFIAAFSGREEPHAAVRFAVRGENVVEYVWGQVLEAPADGPLSVAYLTPPVAVQLDSDVAEVPHDEVVDWQLELDDERAAGGYAQRATFEAIREEYGFLPPDIETELANLVDL